MKGLPLHFDFEGKGVLDLELLVKNKAFFNSPENYPAPVDSSCFLKNNRFLRNSSFGEPTSVLDPTISGGPTTNSTPSSSHGGGGGGGASTDTAGVGALSDANPSPISSHAGRADSDLLPVPPCLETGGGDWENVVQSASPGQDQSIFRWIMGDIGGGGALTAPEFEFGGGFGVADQGDQFGPNFMPTVSSFLPNNTRSSAEKTDLPSNTIYSSAFDSDVVDPKHTVFNLMNQQQTQQTQNPSFFLPFQQDQADFTPPHAKRPNLGAPVDRNPRSKWSFPDIRQEDMLPSKGRQQLPHQLQSLPPKSPFGPDPNLKTGLTEEPVPINHHQQQQAAIIDQLYNFAELVLTGNLILAQGILARLNQFLSPTGKPFNRAAFYCKEALQFLLHTNNNNNNNLSQSFKTPSPFDTVFKIDAYKSFSEISPSVEFANFTCNQALLEAFEGLDLVHIVDFDIGLGGQWAPLMQELAFRGSAPPILKITAIIASHSACDQLGLCLIRDNLIQFASEINLEFEFEVMGIDSLNSSINSGFFRVSGNEAVAVNLPAGCISDYDLLPPLFLRLVKQMSPRVVVSVDVGCQRTDLPFADHIIHVLRSYSSLLESLDAVNVNTDALQRIERFLIHPGIEKIVMSRFRAPGKLQHWRTLFLSSGFSPVEFSNFAESQAECVVKRMPIRGFQVEKRQSSLVLCWQRKELVSASVWRC